MFLKTEGPPDSKIMIVGDAPSIADSESGKPFQGSMKKVLSQLLDLAEISRYECLVTHVAREKPPGGKVDFFFEDKKCLKPKPIMLEWINLLKKEIELYRPNIVIALGTTACYVLTGELPLSKFRGYITKSSLVKDQKILPTYHPRDIQIDWKLFFPALLDIRKAVKNSTTREMPKDTRKLITTMSLAEYKDYLYYILKEHHGPIAVDIETRNPGCHIDIMGIADSAERGVAFEILYGTNPRLQVQSETEIIKLYSEIFYKKPLIMQNGIFDAIVLMKNYGIFCKNFFFDTLIAAHVCWPECPRSLSFLGSVCLNVPAWKHTSQTQAALYNAADAANTYGIHEVLTQEITNLNQWSTFNFEMSQVYPAMMLQMQGLYVNPERKKEMFLGATKRLRQLRSELKQDLGKEVNINSPKQLADLLYIDLRLPVQYKRRKSISETRKVTTDAEALDKLFRKSSNPVLSKILEIKKLNKLVTSFVDIQVSEENKVHTCYNVTGATMARVSKAKVIDDEDSYKSFGRWSSSKSIIFPYGSGNLQNIPYTARLLYTAPEGYEFLQADYMQAEAVVVAYCIDDKRMIKMFKESFGLTREERKNKNLDIHKLTASIIFNVPIESVTKAQRGVGKTIRHANNYSAGPGVLSAKLKCTMKEAKNLLNTFATTTPELHCWHETIKEKLYKDRTLINLLGRKHKFLSQWGDNLFRSAYSFIPQSTVGDLLNKAMVKFYHRYCKEIKMVLQLHDAIYVFSKLGNREENMAKLRECMIQELEVNGRKFCIDVDFSAGPSWGELEEL